jgi:hypothetical protein
MANPYTDPRNIYNILDFCKVDIPGEVEEAGLTIGTCHRSRNPGQGVRKTGQHQNYLGFRIRQSQV